MTVYPESALSKSGDKISHSHSVSFDENMNTYHKVSAYSRYYGFLPQSYVATSVGWKQVSLRADHFTGKDDVVMANRRKINAQRRDQHHIDQFRRSMIRTMSAIADGEQTLLTPTMIHSFLSSNSDRVRRLSPKSEQTGCKVMRKAHGHVGHTHGSCRSEFANVDDVVDAHMSVDEFVALHDTYSYTNDYACMTSDMDTTMDVDKLFAVKTKSPAAKFKKRLGAKAVKSFERDSLNAQGLLKPQAATTYRAISARGNYLGQDRADGSYSSKELCRDFSAPNEHSLQKLKRLGRYYKGKPRLVYKYPFATAPATEITVYCDTDFAGCSQTRRSTSGGCAMIGGSQIKHWSKTQSTIALSSGEAELIGIGSGCAQGLGLQSLAADMGLEAQTQCAM